MKNIKKKFLVSVVIVSYNTKKLTIQAIESVIYTCKDLSYEIIIVDNASSDGSILEIRKLISRFASKQRNIKLFENKSNLGFAKANNRAIKTARGKYILLLNSDTKVKDKSVASLVNFAEENFDVGVVGSKLLNGDGTVQGSVFRLPTIWRAINQYWLKNGKPLDKYAPDTTTGVEVESLVMAAFLITPQALKKVGLLDEKYFMYFEDLDYCRRVRKAGFKIYYYPKSEVYHFLGESGKRLANSNDQWRRLIPSSIIYHGFVKHTIFNFVLWSGQKLDKYIFKK